MKRTIPQLIALIVLASCAHRFQYNAFRERVDQVERVARVGRRRVVHGATARGRSCARTLAA